jgi:hypothetical protein
MTAMQRAKGQAGEREIAALVRDLTGWDVRRRVRQHDGDSDLKGVPGWSVEVKRHRAAQRHQIAAWWAQTVQQAAKTPAGLPDVASARLPRLLPVLFFRADRDQWRAVWPVAVGLVQQSAELWHGYEWTVEGSVAAWAAVARDVKAALLDQASAGRAAAGPGLVALPAGRPAGAGGMQA